MDQGIRAENITAFKNSVCDLSEIEKMYNECLDHPQNHFKCLDFKLQLDKCHLLHQSIEKEYTRHEAMTLKKWIWQVRTYRKEKRYLKREIF